MAEGSEPMSADSRVALAEIQGDIKRIFDNHNRYREDMTRISADHADFRRHTNERLNNHADRLRDVEGFQKHTVGQQTGSDRTVKVAYAIGGVIMTIITALVAALARQLGV